MTTHAEATAAPVDVRLGGKTYRMSPLTGRDIAELENWLQSEALRRVRDSLGDASAAEYERTISAAVIGASSLSLSSTRGAAMFSTVAGLARMLWQGIQRNHPDVTAEQIQTALFSADSMAEAELALERANRFGDVKKKPETRKRVKRKKQTKKRKR